MDVVDPKRLPRTAAYLAELPMGLESYKGCTSRTDVARMMLEEFPHLLGEGVSPGIARTLADAVKSKDTFPDVWGVAIRLMLRDAALKDDASFIRWHLEMAAKVFSTPMYRVLMFVLSPTLVLAGAQRRWNAYRTGTHLSSQGDKTGATLRLTYPQALYPALVARSYAELFRGALIAARAAGVKIEMVAHGPTEARYQLSWQ